MSLLATRRKLKNICVQYGYTIIGSLTMFVFVIKEIRKKKNITVYNLSKLTGISRSYLLELENNKKFNPSLSVMYKIANALEVKIDDLFYTELDLEKLKQELNNSIEIYGIRSQEVLKISQIIDLLINIKTEQK